MRTALAGPSSEEFQSVGPEQREKIEASALELQKRYPQSWFERHRRRLRHELEFAYDVALNPEDDRGDEKVSDIVPLRDVPVSTIVDDVEVRGIIYSLYPKDVTVIMTAPAGGLSSGLHVPYFAMERHRLATSVNGCTVALTRYGRSMVEWLLKGCYEYSRGKRGGWGMDAVERAMVPFADERR